MPTLFDIQHRLIADSSAATWYHLHSAGAGGGTNFHYRWHYSRGPAGTEHQPDEHHGYAVHRIEPSLTMAWGLPAESEEDQLEIYPWLEASSHYPNKSAHTFWTDFFWNGALVDRVALLHIDGGHGTVPLPNLVGGGLVVSHFEAAVASLVHELNAGEGVDAPARYFDQLDLRIEADEDRHGAGRF